MLEQLQSRFFAYLLHGEPAFADDIVNAAQGESGISAEIRLHIYANAYRARLREALDTDHEMLGRYLGDDWYDKMVDGYINAHPSHYVSLRHFGEKLPKFLREHEPFSGHPILADLAAFERLLLDAFDAAEAPRAVFADLQALAPQRWPGLLLRFHPSVQLFVAHTNAVEAWQSLKNQSAPAPAQSGTRRCWLLWRGVDHLSQFRSIAADEEALLRGFLQGSDFADVCEILLQWYGPAEVPANALRILQAWCEDGLVRTLN